MDFATLEIIVDATQADRATDSLDELSEAGERAEKSTEKLSGSTRSYSGAAGRAAEQTARQTAMTTSGAAAMAALTVVTVAATAATAAMIVAWRRRQEIMEEARRETERAIQTLEDLRRETELARQGPGAEWIEPLRLANVELERMRTGTRSAWDDLKEMASTMIQMAAEADTFWEAISRSFWESDTGQGLRDIRDAIMDIDRLTGGRLAKQIELSRLAKEEAMQARITAGEQARIAALLEASARVEERLRRVAEDERRAAEEARRQAERAFQDEIDALEKGRRLRLLTADHVLRALEIEREQLAIARDTNRALAERITATERLAQLAGVVGGAMTPGLAIPGGTTPGGTGGMILTPVTAHGTAGAAGLGALGDGMDILGATAIGFRNVVDAAGELDPVLDSVLRGLDDFTWGVAELRDGLSEKGAAGAISMISGVAAVGMGILGVVDSIIASRERLRQAREAIDRDQEEWRRGLTAMSPTDEAIAGHTRTYQGGVGDIVRNYRDPVTGMGLDDLIPNLMDPTLVDREQLEIIGQWGGAIGQAAREVLETLSIWDQWVAVVRDGARATEEAAAAEQAAQREREESARKAEEAARATSIAMLDYEVAARRAALAGDDLTAIQIRGEAAIIRQQAEWQKLVDDGYMTAEQFTALSDILRDELAVSIQSAADAARRASEDFLGMLTVEDLMAQGDAVGAATERARQWEKSQIERAMGMYEGEQLVDVLEWIGQITQRKIDNILRDAALAPGMGMNRSAVDDDIEQSVVRNARSITSMQASALVDIGRSQLAVLQDIARSTRRMAGGDFIAGIDTAIGGRRNDAVLADGSAILP